MFLETFCILCLIFTVSYFIIAPVKSVWENLPSKPTKEGYIARLNTSDGIKYDLCKCTKSGRILPLITVKAGFRNEILSIEGDDGAFVARIRRMDFPGLGPELETATVRSDNLHELARKIEEIFQSWEKAS